MDLTQGNIREQLVRMAVPAGIGMLFHTFYNVTDTFYAGMINTEALAALSISFPVFFILLAAAVGFSQGTTAIISNYLGSKNQEKACQAYVQSLIYSLIFSTVIGLIVYFISTPIFKFFGAQDSFLKTSLEYMNVIALFAPIMALSLVVNSILNASGDTKKNRNIMIFAFFLNIILNPVLCFGFLFIPALGVKGIAYSTVFVELLTIFYLGYHAFQLPMMKNFKISSCSLKLDYLIDFLKQSVPASLNMLMIAVGFFVIQKFVNVYGSSAAAAYGIALRIEQIILLPSIGLNIALLSIVGQNYGAGNFDRIEKSHFEAIKIGIGLMTIGALILFFFGDFLVKFFTKDPEVIAMADSYLFMAAFLTIIYQFIHMTGSVFQGLKKPMFNTIYTFFRLGALPPFVYHFYSVTLAMGLKGIWWGIFSINLVFAVMIFIHIRKIIVGLKSNKVDQIQTSAI